MLRIKSCLRFFLIALAVLAAVWLAGNLLVDVDFDGREIHNKSLVSTTSSGTLREVFQGLPAEDIAETRITLLDNNEESWAARWRLLAEARNTIDVSYFILHGDIFGFSFLGHLLHKAEEGVQVRILLDAIGTTLSREIEGNDYLDALANTRNLKVKMYRPYCFRLRDAFLKLNPIAVIVSDHDKILVVDGRCAMIGGRNIAREYFADPLDYPRAFRDVDALLSDRKAGADLRKIFQVGFESAKARGAGGESIDIKDSAVDLMLAYEAMDAWMKGRTVPRKVSLAIRARGLPWLDELMKLPHLKGALKEKPSEPSTAEVRLLDSRPRLLRADDAISKSLARLVRSARKEIFIQSPYVILTDYSVSLLEQAAARGVRITIFTNSPVSTDNPLSQAFFLEQWPELLARAPTLRLFVAGDDRNIHAKIGAIDNQLALIGTYNLDPISMSLDGEVVAAAWSRGLVRQLLLEPRGLIAEGPPAAYEYRIARDSRGHPQRDRDGNVVTAFGPEDHSDPEQWKKIQWRRKLLRIASKLPGTSALFWYERRNDPAAKSFSRGGK